MTDFIHKIATNDFFIFFAGLASFISLFAAFFAVHKVNKIKIKIKQKQDGTDNIQVGGNYH